jgi:outer membrane protein OmpA-like peptidoglycan-associated protein
MSALKNFKYDISLSLGFVNKHLCRKRLVMKQVEIVLILVGWLLSILASAQAGLKGEYYNGTNFERKVYTRIDPQINFNWSIRSPAKGIPHSFYSIRWTGKLKAPVTGIYRFFADVDDGIRVWIDNKLVIESWQLNDSQHYVGNITLQAGRYYTLRVDYFNDIEGGEVKLYWQRPDMKLIYVDRYTVPGDIIPTAYFVQREPPTTLVKKPISPIPSKPIVTKKSIGKPNPKQPLVRQKAKPEIAAPVVSTAVSNQTTTGLNLTDKLERGTTYVLPHVQFEQSSYVLQPESFVELNKLVDALAKHPEWHVEVAGHTDSIGDSRLNKALSENRAKVVAHYLIQRGITDSRVTSVGYGGSRPVADNTNESERAKNRRVEFTIK